MTMPGGFGVGGDVGTSSGLPFAGIPPEYEERIEALIADEPEPQVADTEFDHGGDAETAPFGLASFLLPHWRALGVAFVLIAAEQAVVHVGPLLMKLGIDEGILRGRPNVLLAALGAYLAAIAIQWGVSHVRISYTGRVGQRLLYALRIRVFSHLQRLGIDFYTREKGGRIMTRMTSDITVLATLFNEGIVNLAVQGLALLVVTCFLFYMNAQLATVLLVGIVPPMLALTLWFRSASSRAYGVVRDRIADVVGDLQESLAGVRVVAMHNRQRNNVVRHSNVLGRHHDANVDAARISAVYGPSTGALDIVGQCIVLFVGGRMVLRGELQPGELVAFVLYVGALFAPIQELVQLYDTYQSGNAAVRKLRGVLSTKSNVPQASDAIELPCVRGDIRLEAVTFGYDPGVPVLRDVDLHIRPGETLALVGATGSGKSTIAKLIHRFYDPQQGSVQIDGHDLRRLELESLRRQIGVVPQEPFLFAGTLRDNIAFARPEADDATVWEACRAVGIAGLLDRLPQGIHTPCHERGVTLSSGERQLIALARVFLAEPRVLVLDEATSNLDLRTEAMAERALDALLGARTAILVAHRLSTARRADRIAVVHDGRICEVGSHPELLERGGRYAAMFKRWMEHEHEHEQAES